MGGVEGDEIEGLTLLFFFCFPSPVSFIGTTLYSSSSACLPLFLSGGGQQLSERESEFLKKKSLFPPTIFSCFRF